MLFAPDHLNKEKALAASSLKGWAVLRHNGYDENLLMALPQALASGTQYTAAGQGNIPYIARDDLALADAAALDANTAQGGLAGITCDFEKLTGRNRAVITAADALF